MVREHLQKWWEKTHNDDPNSIQENLIIERAMRRRSTIDLRSHDETLPAHEAPDEHSSSDHAVWGHKAADSH
jgi:hypothetical protein